MDETKNALLRQLSKIDTFLGRPRLVTAEKEYSYSVVKSALQDTLQDIRQNILANTCATVPSEEAVEEAVLQRLYQGQPTHLRPVINGTGTVLHTNLGRAVLSETVARQAMTIAQSYANVEYNVVAGTRGSRYSHVEGLLCTLTGAEAALVVNNNAAAVLLVLSAMAKGKEVIISRGELVEIGGLFRIPDVLALSGAILREVGTTNKTHIADYERAVCEDTGAIMKVHTSNYRIIGFAETPSAQEIAQVAHAKGLPFIQDLGSGLLLSMERFGLPKEPTVQEAIASGCDVVTFSGDKLLGGPQAGIIVGKKVYIEAMKQHQLLRALRIDKLTLAALEVTLQQYRQEEQAVAHIPTLHMLALTQDECQHQAERLQQELQQALPTWNFDIMPCDDMVGGGAYPEYTLPGYAVSCMCSTMTAEEIKTKLHQANPPIIGRIQHGVFIISMRTILPGQHQQIVKAFLQTEITGGEQSSPVVALQGL